MPFTPIKKFDQITVNNSNNWYKGNEPTKRETLGQIYNIYSKNNDYGMKAMQNFLMEEKNPMSSFYNPYSQATNKSVSNLSAYGVDTSKIDDNFFKTNDYLRQYLNYDGTTNTPSKPGSKASAAEKAAYEYYQIWKSEEKTQKAEKEWNDLQKELKYWAQQPDRNYTDQEIIDRIDWSKYGELTSMYANDKHKYEPNEYNRSIGYSEDALYGVIWEARNPEYKGDIYGAMAYSSLGAGNQWQDDPELRGRLDPKSEAYSPFTVGSTMEKERQYFGVTSFSDKWVEDHMYMLDSKNEEEQEMFRNVLAANNTTKTLEAEAQEMYEDIISRIGAYYDRPDDLIKLIKKKDKYADLFALDDEMKAMQDTRSVTLTNTTRAIAYRWQDVEQYIRDQCAAAKEDNQPMNSMVDEGLTRLNNIKIKINGPEQEEEKNEGNSGARFDPNNLIAYEGASDVRPSQKSGNKDQYTGKSPYKTLEEIQEEMESRNIGTFAPVVYENGTEAEKTAFESGGSAEFDNAANRIAGLNVDGATAAASVNESLKGKTVSTMPKAIETKREYETLQKEYDALKAEHDRYVAEMEKLEAKRDGVGGATIHDEEAVNRLQQMEGADTIRERLESEDETEQKKGLAFLIQEAEFNNAGNFLTGLEQFDYEWRKARQELGHDPTVEEFLAMDEHQKLGQYRDWFLNGFENDTFFTGADETRLNELYDTVYGVEGRPGINDFVGTEDRLAEMESRIESGKAAYDQSIKDMNALVDDYTKAYMVYGEDLDLDLLEAVFTADEYSTEFMSYPFAAESPWTSALNAYNEAYILQDEARMKELSDEGQLISAASTAVAEKYGALKQLRYIQDNMDALGLQYSDNQKKYIQQSIDVLEKEVTDAANFIYAHSSDFQKDAEAGYRMAKLDEGLFEEEYGKLHDGEQVSQLTKDNIAYLTGTSKYNGFDIAKPFFAGVANAIEKNNDPFYQQFFGTTLGPVDFATNIAAINDSMYQLTEEEKQGYFARLYTEGQDVANAYLKGLVNASNGMVMKRTADYVKAEIGNLTSDGGAGTVLGYIASFGLNAYGTIHDPLQRAKNSLTGQRNVDPNGIGTILSDSAEIARQNVIEQYTKDMDEGNKETFTFLFNAATSAIDSYINSKIAGGFAGGVAQGALEKIASMPWMEKALNWLESKGLGSLASGTENMIVDWVSAMPMAIGAADKAMRQAIIRGADEEQQAKIWQVTFLAESLSEAVTASNIKKMGKMGADDQVEGLFKSIVLGGIEEAFGEGINEYWEQNGDTIIMGAKSERAEMVEALVAQGVPRKTAEDMADAEMWKSVAVSAASGFVSSGFSQSFAYAGGQIMSDVNQAEIDAQRKSEVSKLDAIGSTNGSRDSAAVISSVLRTNIGNDRGMTITEAKQANYASNAAAQLFVSRMNRGSGENARTVTKSLLSLAETSEIGSIKDAMTYASLTDGAANGVLQEMCDKASEGIGLTKQDVQNLLESVQEDRNGPDAEKNAQTYQKNVVSHRVASKEIALIAKNNQIVHRVDEAAAAVTKSQQNVEAAQAKKDAADAKVDAIVGNMQSAVTQGEEGTVSKEDNAKIEQNLNELEGAVKEQQQAQLELDIANKKLDHDVQWLESEQLETMNEVRQEAQVQVDQEMAAEEQQAQVEAEQKAQAEEEAKAAEQQQQSQNNATAADKSDFISRYFPNATDEQKIYIGNAFNKVINEIRADAQKAGQTVTVDELLNRSKVVKDIAKKYGINIEVRDTTEGGKHFFFNGNFNEDTNTITIDNNTSINELMYKVLGHELFHAAKQSGTFTDLADAVIALRYGERTTWDGILKQMESGSADNQLAADLMVKLGLRQMQYEQKQKGFSMEDALEEIVADEMGNILNGDTELVNRLAAEKPGLVRRIISAIKNFIKKAAGMQGDWVTDAQKTVDMLEAALKDTEGYRKERAAQYAAQNAQNNGIKYNLPEGAGTVVSADEQGDPLVQEFTGGTEAIDDGNIKYSLSSFDKKEQDRVRDALLKSGRFTEKQVDQYMGDALGIASLIAQDKTRLDFLASDNQVFLKPNNDYYFTLDASTLCAKRLLYQGTFDYVQHALPNEVFTPEDLIDLVNIMNDMGYETPCGICYVESRRRWLDTYAQEFLETVPKDPKSFVDKRFKKSSDEEKTALIERLSGEMPSIDDLTTSDGLERLRNNDPLMHKAFVAAMNAKGTANPKVVQLRTEYRGDIGKLSAKDIQKVKDIGGLRIQSFSDFETPHLLDMMQAVLDMSSVGLTSQAYTKVPNFAWVFGDTGIKINLSLIGKGTGLDENGNLVFDNREGINFDEAMKLRERYGRNVGTILVGINDDHIVAAMGDPRIDFIIPFHKSGWSAEELRKMPTLNNYSDYTDTQNERLIIGRKADGSYETESFQKHKERTKESLENFQPVGKNGYWNFSKSGQWNAEKYLKKCAKEGRVPKFSQFLVDNGDGSFSLPQGTDKRSTAIREGYWKTLIDFKMYENDSYGRTMEDGTKTQVKGAKQKEVTPNINMAEAYRVMNDYKLGRQMPDKADGTPGRFIEMENNNSVPVAIPAAEEYIELIKRKRAGVKPEGPNPDTLEADLPEAVVNPRATVFGASQAPAVLGNTESTAENAPSVQQSTMAIDAETGETVKYSLPSEEEINDVFDQYIENLSAEELDQLAQELFGISLKNPSESVQTETTEAVAEETVDADFLANASNMYMEAVSSGDIDAARNIVDKIAKAAGYTVRGTHRTNAKFNTFEKSEQTGKNGKALGDGFYVAAGEGTEYDNDAYGKNRMVVYVNPGNTFDIQNGGLTEQQAKDVYDKYFAPYHPNAVGDNPYTSHVIASLQKGYKVIDYIKEAAENAGTTTNEVFKWLGYDSVKDGPQYCVFDSSQIKLADPITYDDEGNAIPIDERYNEQNQDIRYSLPSDAPYLSAVDHGDMKEAQRLVDEAAKEAGYIYGKVYHGTPNNDFTEFRDGYIFFTSNKDTADEYRDPGEMWATRYEGGRTLGSYIRLENPLILDNSYSDYRNEHTPWQEWKPTVYGRVPDNAMNANDVAERAKELGYDGVVIRNDKDTKWRDSDKYLKNRGRGDTIIAFSAEQIKSADPVTYDNNGNVIPLSERFQKENRDIRYSLPSDAPYLSAVDHGDMEEAKRLVDEAAEEAGYTLHGYHGTANQFNEFDISRAGENWEGDSRFGPGFYFAYDRDTALNWTDGMRVVDARLKMENPLDLTKPAPENLAEAIREKGMQDLEKYDSSYPISYEQYEANIEKAVQREINNPASFLNQMKYDSDGNMTDNIREFLTSLGYDGIISDSEMVAFSPEQIKSSEPVTYDDQGNVIPLSERFQKGNKDIRYSLPSDRYLEQQIRQYLESGGSLSQEDIDAYQQKTSRPLEGRNVRWSQQEGPAQRQFGNGMLQESNEISQEAQDYVKRYNAYFPDTNAAQVQRAINWIRRNGSERNADGSYTQNTDGYYESLEKVTSKNFDYRSADGQARMIAMMAMATAKGDVSAQVKLADAFNRQGTDAGRTLQSRKLFRMMTPEGRIATIQKMLNDMQDQLDAKGTNKQLKFSDWIYQAAAAATEENDFAKVQKAAAEELADQLPANWKQKLTGWRMLAMLGNPRTHIRNVLGNFFFMPVVGIKNKVGALMELGTSQENRTKTLGFASQEARAFAKQDAKAMKDTLTGEAKYKDGNLVQQAQKTWGQGDSLLSRTFGKALQAASDLNSNALELEDWVFLNRHYRNALAGYMTARGLTAADMTGQTLEDARAYAVQEAQKATYRDANKLATMLNDIGRKGGIIGFGVNAVLPFKKTPANILRRGLEYSGVGLMKSLTVDAYHMKQYMDYQNGKLNALPEKAISPNQWIDKVSSGLTGTGIMALGAFLAAIGAIKVSMGDDDEFDKLRGSQNYSVELFGHDVSMTIDWAAPMSMPLFVGAAMYEAADDLNSGEGVDVGALAESILNITEPVTNLSMLDGVNNLLDVSYGEGDTITKIGEKILTNYASSYVPTIVGQAARTIDTTRRKSYVESGASMSTFRYAWEQIENKIPFLSKSNIPYRNAWGETDESSTVGAALENFLSPAYFNDIKEDPVTDELERLYNTVSDKNKSAMVPKMPTKKIGNEALNAEQYDQLTVDRGQTAHQLLAELMMTPEYIYADDETRAEMVNDIWTYCDQTAKNKLTNGSYNMDSWVAKSDDPIDGVIDRAIKRNQDAQKDGYSKALTVCLDDYDLEDAQTAIEGLRRSGMTDSSIKSKVTSYYKPIYQEAYRKGDMETMFEIEDMLDSLDDDITWKYNDWLNGIDDEEEEEETGRDTSWLNRNQ